MKRNAFLSFALLLAVAFFTGCSSDSSSPTGGGNNNTTGGIKAQVNGSAWAATDPACTWQNNALSISGAEIKGADNRQINIAGLVTATGTYSLAPLQGMTASYTEGNAGSVKIFSATSGTLVVTELSATAAKGTFSFEAKNAQGGSETRSISDGTFDVKF